MRRAGTLALVLAALLLLAACVDPWKTCKANGGHVERFNCHEHTTLIPQFDANNNIVALVPFTTTDCDERCVGASLEAR